MPLLARRRSLLDLVTSAKADAHDNHHGRPGYAHSNHRDTHLLTPDAQERRPSSEHGPSHSHSRLSHELHPDDIPEASTDTESVARSHNKRFSLMRFRNYSESHLATKSRMDAERLHEEEEDLPPVPSVTAEGVVPSIVKTAPPTDQDKDEKSQRGEDQEERKVRPSLFKRSSSRAQNSSPRKSMDERRKGTGLRWRRGKNNGLEDLHRLSAMHINNEASSPHGNYHNTLSAPPSYNDIHDSALAVPVAQLANPRYSESSRSDASSGDGPVYGSTTTTTHTVSTHTTFFKIPRRKKNRNSLFPLPVKIPPPNESQPDDLQDPATPRASTSVNTPEPQATPEQQATLQRRHTETSSPTKRRPHSQSSPAPHAALAKTSLSFAEPGLNLFRNTSQQSQNSPAESPLQPPMRLGFRDRSSTTSSFGRSSQDRDTPPPLSASGRTSTSTAGRSSLGGLLNLSRFRQSSEPHSPRHGSPGLGSKQSFALSREALVIPEREEGDSPGKYLERLENAVSKSVIAGILSKSADPFAAAVLRSYTRRFPFFGEPIDMSLRKFLLEAELPKETQQVDRVIQAFADRYHECNPGIFPDSSVAYVVAFSIMMLHTDAFNKNNKRKMQKQDYIKNTSGQGLSDDILACFYDNICYTPFIHFDEDVDINGEKMLPFKTKKSHAKLKTAIPGAEAAKKPSGPVDPYLLLVEQKLDTLRPTIKDTILFDDPYDYRASMGDLDPAYLQRAFTHTGVLQIISARSRPAAYEHQVVDGNPNPTETQQGIVDLKITKVGTLWRKSSKKKKTRSPWQEWGAILTGSQLYLFKNSHWAKGLLHQFQHQQKPNQPRTPVVFKPPLPDFKPDALIKTDNAVALVDSTYTRHKNAFTFVRPGGQEEVLLADNEHELNDWLGLINYAAAFRAAGVRIRGMVGGAEEDLRNRDIRRLDSTNSVRSVQTTASVVFQNRGLSPQLQKQVMAARRQIVVQKIAEIEKEITDSNRNLENMLRNARHLLILAPIAPRTREGVIHAAARADAMIKWLRRDIWRLKCHRDILAMDMRQDGVTASDLEKLASNQAQQRIDRAESSKKDRPRMLTRLGSSRISAAKSPPLSPVNVERAGRPSTTSVEVSPSNEVFRTPPESATSLTTDQTWRLPPLNLDINTSPTALEPHRPSVASTLLSTPATRGSLTHSSSASSVLQVQRTNSTGPLEIAHGRQSPLPDNSIDQRELELLARATMGPAHPDSVSRSLGIEGGSQINASPESKHKHKSVRRSLQKTLRDGHHHHSTHKHRRNKDSDSTVRSGPLDEHDAEEATPGLQRDKPRFILHGKQASVVQFGGDWDRMKQRREQYEGPHPSTQVPENKNSDYADYAAYERRRSEQHELLRAGMTSPVVRELRRHQRNLDEEDDDSGSMMSVRTQSFREDAEAAAAYSAFDRRPSASPMPMSSDEDVAQATPEDRFFDLSQFDAGEGRRTTVIGPSQTTPQSSQTQRRRKSSNLVKDETGNVSVTDNTHSSDDDISELSPSNSTGHRRTVIGPARRSSIRQVHSAGRSSERKSSLSSAGRPSYSRASLSESAISRGRAMTSPNERGESSGNDSSSVEGEYGIVQPISDDQLRMMTQL